MNPPPNPYSPKSSQKSSQNDAKNGYYPQGENQAVYTVEGGVDQNNEVKEDSLLPKGEIGYSLFGNNEIDEKGKWKFTFAAQPLTEITVKESDKDYISNPDARESQKIEEEDKSGRGEGLKFIEETKERPATTIETTERQQPGQQPERVVEKPVVKQKTLEETEPTELPTRRIHAIKQTECSDSRDPWMKGMNPLPEFKEWLYEKRKAEGSAITSLANAASEIRNDYPRAKDLWEELQRSTKDIVGGFE